MTRLSKTLSALTATGLVVAGLVAAAPAVAAPSTNALPTMPANQKLFAIDCDSTNAVYTIAVTATSALATPVGSVIGNGDGTPANDESTECSKGIAYNPVDGFVYGILDIGNNSGSQMFPNTSASNLWLVKVDPSTGVQTLVAEFSGACGSPWTFAIDNNGVAYATDSPHFCSVNLATAVTTEIGTDVIGGGSGEPSDWAMGFDGKNNTLYMFSSNYEIYSMNTTTGAATLAATLPASYEYDCGGYTDDTSFDASAGFDSNGIAWIQGDTCDSMPIVWNPATNEYWYTDVVTAAANVVNTDGETVYTAGQDFYVEGFAVITVKDPALAETGVDANELPAGALIGGGLLLAGAVAWVARRRIAAKR